MYLKGWWVASLLLIAGAAWTQGVRPVYDRPAVLETDGTEGLCIEEGLRSEKGFAIDLEVKFSEMGPEQQIASQEGLFLLRADPKIEGGQLSFFVNIAGQVEPRLRTVSVAPNQWHRVTASWDGRNMWMRVDGQAFRASRVGPPEALGHALLIGIPGPKGGGALNGAVRNLRVYGQPLTEVESLLADTALPAPPEGGGTLDFARGIAGWTGAGASVSQGDGTMDLTVDAPLAAVATRTALPGVTEGGVLTVRMAADGGAEAKLYAHTDGGKVEVLLPINADGRMHSYTLYMDEYPEWRGALRTLGLAFTSATARARVAWFRAGTDAQGPPECVVEQLFAAPPYVRAERAFTVTVNIRNTAGAGGPMTALLHAPPGMTLLDAPEKPLGSLAHDATTTATWQATMTKAGPAALRVEVTAPGMTTANAEAPLTVAESRAVTPAAYLPPPRPVPTKRLVGVHYCPLWKEGARSGGWGQIEPYPQREPLLGWYDENNPEVTDWEVKWALDHGINFFVYCWYREGQEGPVEPFLGHALHEGLFKSRHGNQLQFAIMWENQFKGHWGANSKEDLLDNLFPFWMDNYFQRENYLVIDNKPVLFIYRTERVIEDLGSEAAVREAFAAMRAACKDAGFDGLYILGEDRHQIAAPLEEMARVDMDASFTYCVPIANDPDDAEATRAQEEYWTTRRDLGILPDIPIVSMGWDSTPWHESLTKWKMSPEGFEEVCRKANAFMDTLPADSIASKFVLLDNWNEFGEGHYIFPHREMGFGYLDAVRRAFSDASEEHEDLVPRDLGRGPYDSLYTAKKAAEEAPGKKAFAPGGDEPDLLAWWTFDEAPEATLALDYTGHGLGGLMEEAKRATGFDGLALVCDGGSARMPASKHFAPRKGLTLMAWVKTDVPNQDDAWFANRIHGGRESSGFRFGLSQGKLVWAVPQRHWSHHLHAGEPLPVGRWVHVAATCDREAIHIYQDGNRIASLPRHGVVKENGQRLVLGNYDVGHRAHFQGLLDEVRLYGRALTEQEIQDAMRAQRSAAKGKE